MTIALPPTGTEYSAPKGTILVTGFATHAVMVDTLDKNAPAVPAVQLQLDGNLVGPTGEAVTVTAIIECAGAAAITAGINNCLQMLENIRRNQER